MYKHLIENIITELHVISHLVQVSCNTDGTYVDENINKVLERIEELHDKLYFLTKSQDKL